MNERIKKLVNKLTEELGLKTYKFLANNLEDEEETGDVIDLVLSGHISSLCSCMITISGDLDEPGREKVKVFINKLQRAISKIKPITKIEKIS